MSSAVTRRGQSPLLAGLNQQQREAVLAAEGPVLILAGAGSGKTRVITHRIAHLVRERGVPPEQHPGRHLHQQGGGRDARARRRRCWQGTAVQSWISTFHASACGCCAGKRRRPACRRDFLIYDDDDQMAAVREALRDLDLSEKLHPPRRLLSRISAAQEPARARAATTRGDGLDAATTLARGERAADGTRETLAAPRAPSTSTTCCCARVRCCRSDAAVREAYQRRFRYLLVDEYQDTNRVQYELVRLLAGGTGTSRWSGDEDQSIYSWRGADIQQHPRLRGRLPRRARAAAGGELPLHARPSSTPPRALVAHNRRAQGQDPARGEGGGRARAAAPGRATSSRRRPGWWSGSRRPRGQGRAAVLFRINAQSRLFEEALLRAGHPLHGGGRRGLLRAQGGEGRPRLPAPRPEPARRRGAAPRDQRARARDRRRGRWRSSRRRGRGARR